MSLPPALQNKNVQIAIIAVGILVGLGLLMYQILGSGGASGPPPEMGMGPGGYSPPGYPGGPPGGMPMGPGGPMGYPGSTGGYPGGPGGTGIAGYGTDTSGGAAVAGLGGTQTPVKKAGPRPPSRKDPFKAPNELVPPPVPIAERLPTTPPLYVQNRLEEINTPTPEQFIRDVPDPPMRMAGALFGNRVYGVLEINGQTQVVNPGDKVGIYRVERVERDKIILSRPSRRGRKRVEAQLTGNPALANQYPTGDTGVPGGPAGYGGAPGYGPPGGGGGGRTGG
jgi:hypothetical protein